MNGALGPVALCECGHVIPSGSQSLIFDGCSHEFDFFLKTATAAHLFVCDNKSESVSIIDWFYAGFQFFQHVSSSVSNHET